MKPFFSIVVTNYNYEAYILSCLTSIWNQSCEGFTFEVITVDDKSPDGSRKVIAGFADPRFTFYLKEENTGVVDARNIGFAHSKGEYFLYVDADDWMCPDFLQNLYNLIQKDPKPLYHFFERVWSDRDQEYFVMRNVPVVDKPVFQFPTWLYPIETFKDLMKPQCTFGMNFCFSRELYNRVGGFDRRWKAGWEDFDFYIRCLKFTDAVASHLEGVVYRWCKPNYQSQEIDIQRDYARICGLVKQLFLLHPEFKRSGYIVYDRHFYPEDFFYNDTPNIRRDRRYVTGERLRRRPVAL